MRGLEGNITTDPEFTPEEILRDVRELKRKISFGVYAVVTLYVPLYLVFGCTWQQVAFLATMGWIVAALAIWFVFRQIAQARKHAAYPALIMLEAGNVNAPEEAARRSLGIIDGLIRPQASFLALLTDPNDRTPGAILATSDITVDSAMARLDAYGKVLEKAMDTHYPMEVPSEVGDIRVMLVPVVALKKSIGVLYLAGFRGNTDIADKRLLSDIGSALGIALDHLRQKEELLHKESRLASLMTGAPVVLFAIDTHGVVTFMQGRGMERLGVTPDIVVGRTVGDVFGAYPQIIQSFRRAYAGEEITSSATLYLQERTVMVIFEYRLAPERDESGRVIGIIGVATDITETKLAEEALHESQRALETLVSNLPGFAYRCRYDEKWTLEYISDGVEEITGYPANAFVPAGMAFVEVIHPDDREMVREVVQAGVNRHKPYRLEYRLLTRFGDEKWVWEQGQAIYDDDSQVVALEGFINDITERKRAEQKLAESEERHRDLFENARDAIFSYDLYGHFLSANDQFLEVLGITRDELPNVLVSSVVPPEYHGLAADRLKAVYAGDPAPYELEILSKNGERIPLEIAARIVFDKDGTPVMVQGVGRDTRERKRAERALADSEERYRDLFENANDTIFTHDLSGRFQSLNRKAEELSGYARSELLGKAVWKVVAPEYQESTAEHLRNLVTGRDEGPFEIDIIAKDGTRIPVEVSERILFDDAGQAVLVQGIARDIRERRQAEETIRRLAYHDALTGLPNRALFEDRLAMALAGARRQNEQLAVMFLDLDRFKVVNDTLGHNAGDRLLEAVARDLQAIVRDGDTVARLGGDEFTILLPSLERAEDATDIASRILEQLQQPRVIEGQEFRTTGSIGITLFPADGDDGETLLRNADTAMYRAKESGRDNYQLYTRAMNEKMLERLAFENDLRHALVRGELTLFYQPIADVQTGALTGAEALLRWRHPQKGLVLPDDFVPFAEESGLIVEIGDFVLREACAQMREWRAAGVILDRVSVNLSARQLQQEDVVPRIAQALRDSGVEPELVHLEITEGAVLKNVDRIISTLHQLRQMGIGIALDDFGTGYSSLTYLKRFPIDAVKIDRSFVRDLETDASDATIVTTVIAMAENLRLKVIAEGVETESQLAFLRERGCEEFQGFLLSEPVAPEEFAKLDVVQRGGLVTPPRKGTLRLLKP